ncbi:MAG: hypothetical protein SFT93_00770 [Rickettsiaceae bacterium]|nr:hypothetical protein [Rickettsiaceae bacterium]
MKSTSERSYGAVLENAKKLLITIQSFANYQASRTEDSIAEFQKLINDCDKDNSTVATSLGEYTNAVDKRTKAFLGKDTNSINKLLSPLGKAIASQYDKTSKEYNIIMGIINRMRAQKLEKAPANPTEDKKESISKSELSYGSKLQNFKDLISNLEVFGNFNPANAALKIDQLKTLVGELETLNTAVNSKLAPLTLARNKRKELFEELGKRAQRIKANVSSIYGNSSVEYKQVKGLKV